MLKHITLNLAREPDFPEGSAECGYDIVAPLDAAGHLDLEGWHKAKRNAAYGGSGSVKTTGRGCSCIRQAGRMAQPGGSITNLNRARKRNPATGSTSHQFVANEYVVIRDASGHPHTFKIKEIHPA